MSSRKPHKGIPVPGDRLAFKTVEEFGDWLESSREGLISGAVRARQAEKAVVEDILGEFTLKVLTEALWRQFDPEKGSAYAWIAACLDSKVIDYFRTSDYKTKNKSLSELDESGLEQYCSDGGRTAKETLAEIDGRGDQVRIEVASDIVMERFAKLSALEQQVIRLTVMEEVSEKDAMKTLGLNRDRVAYLKRSGLKKMRQYTDLAALNPYVDE